MSTYNSTTATLSVGSVVVDNQLIVRGAVFDSDTVGAIIAAAESVSANSDLVQDQITTALAASADVDSDRLSNIEVSLVAVDAGQETRIAALEAVNTTAFNSRITSLENNDTVQDASIAGNATDVSALKTYTGVGAALTTTATDLAAAVNEHDAEIGDVSALTTTATNLAAAIVELDGAQGDVSTLATAAADLVAAINALEVRVAQNTSDIANLISRVGGGATPIALNDLSDVTAGSPTNGQQLTWNGSDWTADNA